MKLISILFAAALVFVGCDDHDHDHGHGHGHGAEGGIAGAIEEGCEHLQQGPATAVTAGAEATGAPAGYFEHQRVDVTLADDGNGGFEGYLTLNIPAAGEAVFVLDPTTTLGLSAGGTAITAESSEDNPSECAAASRLVIFDVGVGEHILHVQSAAGSTASAEVSYVLEVVSE